MTATAHSLRSIFVKLGQSIQRLTALKRLSVLHVDKVVTHLADRYLPLGLELSDSDRRLLRDEVLHAQKTTPEALKQLSDVVGFFKNSEFRSVREFAAHCSINEFVNRRIDGSDFLREEGTATLVDSVFAFIMAGVVIFMELGRTLLFSYALIAAAWMLILGLPFVAALINPTTSIDVLAHAMEQALSTALARWTMFCDSGVVALTSWFAFMVGFVRFIWENVSRHCRSL